MARAPKPSTEKAPAKEKRETKLQISFAGATADRLQQIRVSELNLLTVFGKVGQQDVIVPLIDWRLFGRMAFEEVVDETSYGEKYGDFLISFDNLAFLLQDISKDLGEAMGVLGKQVSPDLPLAPGRMDYASRMLRIASEHLRIGADLLDGLVSSDPSQGGGEKDDAELTSELSNKTSAQSS